MLDLKWLIGRTVCKTHIGKIKDTNVKPFKSGNKVNTVKGIIIHPVLNVPAYTFEEDDSYVECTRVKPANKCKLNPKLLCIQHKQNINNELCETCKIPDVIK